MFKNFSIFKNSKHKEGDKLPHYKMSMKVGEEFTEIGACWLKEGKSGKYFSCKLSDIYVDHTKGIARKGFVITEETKNEIKSETQPEVEQETNSEIPF